MRREGERKEGGKEKHEFQSRPRHGCVGALASQVAAFGVAVPGMAAQRTLVPQVFVLLVLVTIFLVIVPSVVLCGLLFLLGFLVVQVYFLPLECHMILFLVFSK